MIRLARCLLLAAAVFGGGLIETTPAEAQTRPITRQPLRPSRTPQIRPRAVDLLPPPSNPARRQAAPQAAARPQAVQDVAPPASAGPLIAPTIAAFGDELAAISAHVAPTVVHIYSQKEAGGAETGSGVLMPDTRPGGIVIVTNRHVVAGAPLAGIIVKLHDGRELQPVEKAEDPQTDLAILRLRERGLPTSQWADSDSLKIGHFVIAAGSPFGLQQSVTLGIVSAKGRRALDLSQDRGRVINQDFIQTDAAINPGNSGGPLFAMDGRVVGINTAIASKSGGNDGIGFSIPSRLARYVSTQLLKAGVVRRGYLGVALNENFNAAVARRLNLAVARGAHVTNVRSGSPADRATLMSEDVVISFNGRDVEDEHHLMHLVSLTPPNQAVALIVMRNGRRVPLQVRLAERPHRTADALDVIEDAPRIGGLDGPATK